MKHYALFIFVLLCSTQAGAQSLAFEKPVDTIKIASGEIKEHIIKIKCEGCYASQDFSAQLKAIDYPEELIQITNDEDDMETLADKPFELVLLIRGKESLYGKVAEIKLKNSTTKKDKTKLMYLYLQKKEDDKASARKNNENRLLYLNAGTFDFLESKINYVGHVNLFSPNTTYGEDTRFGFNTGIMKLNYWMNNAPTDTLQQQRRYENISLNPLKTLDSGGKYLKQSNLYSTRIKNTVYSFYVQPLIDVMEKNSPNAQIYAHLHAELLVSRYEATTTVANQLTDTAIYAGSDNGRDIALRDYLPAETTRNRTYLNGYFGAGFTFNLVPWKDGTFFFQPTFGITTDHPYDVPLTLLSGRPRPTKRIWSGFYLVRAYYSQKLSNSASLILGTDIRGLLPTFDPAYAAYAGVNISVEEAFKLLGIKLGSEEK